MTYLPPGMDRAAGSTARRLLGLASGRHSSSDRPWIQALAAEVDEMETGLDQLTWAVGVLPLVLAERGAALGHRWRPRLSWLASAGGLGALRVYGPAVVSGIAMLVWIYAQADPETDSGFVAMLRLLPFYALFYVVRGLLVARRRSDDVAAAVGAATAVVGFLVVLVGVGVYIGITVSGGAWAAFALMGVSLVFGLAVAAVGAACGLLGAALAHPTRAVRAIRSRRR